MATIIRGEQELQNFLNQNLTPEPIVISKGGVYSIINYTLGLAVNKFNYPVWWTGEEIETFYSKGIDRTVGTNFDVEDEIQDLLLETPYYIATDGVNSNDGLSSLTPFKTLKKARDVGAKLIYIEEGIYVNGRINGIYNWNNEAAVIGVGNVIVTSHDENTVYTPYNSIFTTPDNGSLSVLDASVLDGDGFWDIPTYASSIVDCENTVNSWFRDGGLVYINPQNSINDIYVNISDYCIFNSQHRFYAENITFTLGVDCGGGGATLKAGYTYLKDIKSPYPTSTDGTLTLFGGIRFREVNCISQDCYTAKANGDGFGYSDASSGNAKCTEIRGTSIDSGFYGATGGSDQASTAHNDISILRINPVYTNGEKQLIADVGTTQTIILGGVCKYTKSIGSGNYRFILAQQGYALNGLYLNSDGTNISQEGVIELTLDNCISEHTSLVGNVIII